MTANNHVNIPRRVSSFRDSKRKLRDVQCARLDVHELARDGKLTLGKRGRLFGTVWFEVAGGPDAQRLVLESASGQLLEPLRQVIAATGAGHITAGATSCSYAANVADRRVYSMLGTFLTASGFSPAASVRA